MFLMLLLIIIIILLCNKFIRNEKKKRETGLYFATNGAWPLKGFDQRHEFLWLMFEKNHLGLPC